MKKETLEDFTKEVLQDEFFTNIAEYGKAERLIEIGAKWQQKRSYSEEEKDLLNKMFNLYWYENNNEHEDNLEEWELSKRLFNKL